ncbi:hypothetical protein [Christiangramia forsetii]|uniref:Secreted protein n=2 Tax=Christiangramia forsetii TaxID=411153 RepID=A0M5V4_CHRFK|nr:hypothetical protein [Christiangramia forsetii]GGG32097.1 hypothetical protein GCM10011532_14480 [Christiangramia forsetii]CAL67999.1 secreted protein [Christiangramia forsetii KT0803]
MKKIALGIMTIGAMFFATNNLHAQVEEVEVETEMEMEVEQEEFASVEVMALPQAVKDAVMTDYNGAVASEAWVKSEGDLKVYKLKLDVKGETEKVFIDQDGNWIEEDDLDESKE